MMLSGSFLRSRRSSSLPFAVLLGVKRPVLSLTLSRPLQDSRVSMVPPPDSVPSTYSAFSTARIVLREIVALKQMSALAVGLPSLVGAFPVAAQNVFLMRDGLQVPGIHASAIPTKVVKAKTLRNGANEYFISEAMRFETPNLAVLHSARIPIPADVRATRPFPAFGRTIGVSSQPILKLYRGLSHTRKLTESRGNGQAGAW